MLKKSNANKFSSIISNKSNSNFVIRLPVEILLKIFNYLSPKQLCLCSQVCKQWNQVSNSNQVWKKIFQCYHINKPISEEITFKEEYIKRGREFILKKLRKDIDIRHKQHKFPNFDELRKLYVSIVGDIFDKKDNLLSRHSQKIESIISEAGVDVRFNWQKKIDAGKFPFFADIFSITITVLIPGLINNLVPVNDTVNNRVKLYRIYFGSLTNAVNNSTCRCSELSQYFDQTIEWHLCVPTFLIGLWPQDRSVAYLNHFLSLMDIQATVERLLVQKKQAINSSPSANISSGTVVNLSETKCLRFYNSKSLTDLKCTLIIDNIEPSETLLYNCWRSVDYFAGMPLKLIDESDVKSHQQMKENIEFKPSLGHFHVRYKNMFKVTLVIVSAFNDPIWSYSSVLAFSLTTNSDVDFVYRNTQWIFEDDLIRGTLTNDDDGRMYVTHFCIK